MKSVAEKKKIDQRTNSSFSTTTQKDEDGHNEHANSTCGYVGDVGYGSIVPNTRDSALGVDADSC